MSEVLRITVFVFLRLASRYPASMFANLVSGCESISKSRIPSIDAVFGRTWISRAWTFQEIILASNPVILCGSRVLTWDEFASIIYDPDLREQFENPNLVAQHWKSIFQLWLSLPRPYHARNMKKVTVTTKETGDLHNAPCFQDHLVNLRKPTYCSYWTLHLTYSIIAYGIYFILFGIWAYTWMSAAVLGKDKLIDLLTFLLCGLVQVLLMSPLQSIFMSSYFSFDYPWQDPSRGLYGYSFTSTYSYHKKLELPDDSLSLKMDETVEGWNSQRCLWLGIKTALHERECHNPHDKVFSLFGVLKACGAELSTPGGLPNYGLPLDETYRILWKDLFTWQPRALQVLLFAGTRFPMFAPTMGASWALPWNYDEVGDEDEVLQPWREKVFDEYYDMYVKAGPLGIELLGPTHARLKVKGQRVGSVAFSTQFKWTKPLDDLQLESVEDGNDCNEGIDLPCLIKLWKWRRAVLEMDVDQEKAWRSMMCDCYIPIARFTFEEFRKVCDVLDRYKELTQPPSSGQEPVPAIGQSDAGTNAEGHDIDEGWSELLHDVSALACSGLQTVLRKNRGLFIISKEPDHRSSAPANNHNDGARELAAGSTGNSETAIAPISMGTAGKGPVDTQKGDVVFILAGVPLLMVLRPVPSYGGGRIEEHVVYKIVGPASISSTIYSWSDKPGERVYSDLVYLPCEEEKLEDVVLV